MIEKLLEERYNKREKNEKNKYLHHNHLFAEYQ